MCDTAVNGPDVQHSCMENCLPLTQAALMKNSHTADPDSVGKHIITALIKKQDYTKLACTATVTVQASVSVSDR